MPDGHVWVAADDTIRPARRADVVGDRFRR
jgi:hypothetical protein